MLRTARRSFPFHPPPPPSHTAWHPHLQAIEVHVTSISSPPPPPHTHTHTQHDITCRQSKYKLQVSVPPSPPPIQHDIVTCKQSKYTSTWWRMSLKLNTTVVLMVRMAPTATRITTAMLMNWRSIRRMETRSSSERMTRRTESSRAWERTRENKSIKPNNSA